MIPLQEYLKELKKWSISYEVIDWQIKLSGGDWKARKQSKEVLSGDEDLQAMLILYAANKDSNLRDVIEERACIRWAEELPYDLLSAVKCHMRRCCSEGKR